jgi:hypothetical protein
MYYLVTFMLKREAMSVTLSVKLLISQRPFNREALIITEEDHLVLPNSEQDQAQP